MKIYKWDGSGYCLKATVIVVADCMESATEMIEKELFNHGLSESWEETKYIEEIEANDCRLIYVNNGDG